MHVERDPDGMQWSMHELYFYETAYSLNIDKWIIGIKGIT